MRRDWLTLSEERCDESLVGPEIRW
jgi:hypothetical protein